MPHVIGRMHKNAPFRDKKIQKNSGPCWGGGHPASTTVVCQHYFTTNCTGWTSLSECSTIKLAMTVHRCLRNQAPTYLTDHIFFHYIYGSPIILVLPTSDFIIRSSPAAHISTVGYMLRDRRDSDTRPINRLQNPKPFHPIQAQTNKFRKSFHSSPTVWTITHSQIVTVY